MSIALSILILIAGLALIVLGADWLVDGASGGARRAGISEFLIGLTIVGFGTSCPELVVSLTGAFAGNSDISIGNVVGSNICNTLLILGLTAVIAPLAITKENKNRDIPINLLVTVMLILMGMNATILGIGEHDGISRIEGLVFLLVFAAYMYFCFKSGTGAEDSGEDKKFSIGKCIFLIICGLGGLIGGGQLFVNSATDIAHQVGVSDKFIAITVLAGGTSLPELATCVVAAAKKKSQLALGNVLGSNVFNILLILGCAAVVNPLDFSGMSLVDMGVLLASVVLLMFGAFAGKKMQINRAEGALLLACETGYLIWLFTTL